MSESTHHIEDLVRAVRELPPSTGATVSRFAVSCYDKGNDDGTISGSALAEIVNNWPGACEDGKRRFLLDNGVQVVNDSVLRIENSGFELVHLGTAPYAGGLQNRDGIVNYGLNMTRDQVVQLRDFLNVALGE